MFLSQSKVKGEQERHGSLIKKLSVSSECLKIRFSVILTHPTPPNFFIYSTNILERFSVSIKISTFSSIKFQEAWKTPREAEYPYIYIYVYTVYFIYIDKPNFIYVYTKQRSIVAYSIQLKSNVRK